MYNNEVYYSSNHDGNGIELWKYDGINAPVRLTDINTSGNSTGSKPFAFQNIKPPIAIHVVSEHLGTADIEHGLMLLPDWITDQRSGLFPPAAGFEDVGFAVAA